ncbi:MAG: hypothetical protein ACREQJ_16980 [Candidatus Binatia bacterium]
MTTQLMRFGTAAALVVLSSMPAFGQATSTFNCTQAAVNLDGDGDGFVDSDECAGLGALRVCNGTTTRANCLDPNGRDVFVLFVPASATNIPADPLSLVNQAAGGLNIAAHSVAASQVGTGRLLIAPNSTQKVVRVTESKLTGSGILGVCEHGTPNGLDDCIVYTERAKAVAASMNLPAIDVIRWVINHEVGHAVYLTAVEDPLRGHHEPAGSGYVMQEAMTKKSGAPKQFSEGSRTDVRLK